MFNREPRVTNFTMKVSVLRLGEGFLATAMMAGVQFRGNRYPTRVEAARDLFAQLSAFNNLQANLALDLAASGDDYSTISDELPKELLGDGS